MTRKRKVLIILHLCFVFSYLFWMGTQPFLRQVTATKACSLLFDSIAKSPRFEKLPDQERIELLVGRDALKSGSFQPLVTKFHISKSGMLWAILSLAVCFFLLFDIEGAAIAAWLLPLTIVVYAFALGHEMPLKGERLFPEEDSIASRYIEEGETFKRPRERLSTAWNRYLITEWTHETPSEDLPIQTEQLEVAVFNFNIERAHWVLDQRGEDAVVAHLLFHPSFAQVIAYLIWNLVFAWRMRRRSEARSLSPSSAPA